MANCFGDMVDDEKLDEMVQYVGRPKRQEDRAREAMRLINEHDKNHRAARYADTVYEYQTGVCARCLIYNGTGETLHYVADVDWYGLVSRTPYPTEIGNGQWASFVHTKNAAAASGAVGAVVYRGKNQFGFTRDFLFAWSTPWGIWYRNKALCDVGSVGSFERRWNQIYNTLVNGGYNSSVNRDGVILRADTATGGSPRYTATVSIPHSARP